MWSNPYVRVIAFVLAILVVMALLARFVPGTNLDQISWQSAVYTLTLAGLIGGGLIFWWQESLPRTLLYGFAWLGIFLALILAYSFRGDLAGIGDRVRGELMPAQGIEAGDGSVTYTAAGDGHFHVEGQVDGIEVRFLVDTGASRIALSPRDARRLGFNLARLDYSEVFSTANGLVAAAPVTLKTVRVGPITLRNVAASVHREGLDQSLLGMSFLGRLEGIEMSRTRLTLRQ